MEATTLLSPLVACQMASGGVALKDVCRPLRIQTFGINTEHVTAEPVEAGERRRKKRNRWGDAAENKAAGLMGLPTMIKANMTNEQLEAYTLHLRIQEISEKLRINDVVPAEGDR